MQRTKYWCPNNPSHGQLRKDIKSAENIYFCVKCGHSILIINIEDKHGQRKYKKLSPDFE